MKGIIRKTSILGVSLMLGTSLFAQSKDSVQTASRNYSRGWYVGVQAGMPMAEGTFSSFGADKFCPGWNAGIHGGYRFTNVWSLEMTANWGQQFLAEQDCCFDRGYFLGTDWNRYHPDLIPADMLYKGMYYKDLKSRTFVRRYGLQVNMNVLGFFNRTKESRWRLEISPAVYGVGTSSDIVSKADDSPMKENISKWHFGYGGQAQVSYAIAENMNLGIYGGFTHLTGEPMDGMPEIHLTNFIIDAGIKFTVNFGKKRKNVRSAETVMPTTIAPTVQTETTTTEANTEVVEQTKPAEPVPEQPQETATEIVPIASELTFPKIYFSFNSVWIEPSERAKVKQIADMLKADESVGISITGWGDANGGEEINKRVSLQRAEAIKAALIKQGIDDKRIETVGGGINRDAKSNAEARIAATTEVLER